MCVLTLTHTHYNCDTHTCGGHTVTHRETHTQSLSLLEGSESFHPLGAYTSSEKEGKGKEERELETRVERAREEEEGDGEEGSEKRKEEKRVKTIFMPVIYRQTP